MAPSPETIQIQNLTTLFNTHWTNQLSLCSTSPLEGLIRSFQNGLFLYMGWKKKVPHLCSTAFFARPSILELCQFCFCLPWRQGPGLISPSTWHWMFIFDGSLPPRLVLQSGPVFMQVNGLFDMRTDIYGVSLKHALTENLTGGACRLIDCLWMRGNTCPLSLAYNL